MIKCDIMEDPLITLCRFINELRTYIKHELEMHKLGTIEDSYQKALEVERYLRYRNFRRVFVYSNGTHLSRLLTIEDCMFYSQTPLKVLTGLTLASIIIHTVMHLQKLLPSLVLTLTFTK